MGRVKSISDEKGLEQEEEDKVCIFVFFSDINIIQELKIIFITILPPLKYSSLQLLELLIATEIYYLK